MIKAGKPEKVQVQDTNADGTLKVDQAGKPVYKLDTDGKPVYVKNEKAEYNAENIKKLIRDQNLGGTATNDILAGMSKVMKKKNMMLGVELICKGQARRLGGKAAGAV